MEVPCSASDPPIWVNNSQWQSTRTVINFREGCDISYTGKESDIISEPCIPGENICTCRPPGSSQKYLYYYECMLGTLRVGNPFTDFEAGLLTMLNVAHT